MQNSITSFSLSLLMASMCIAAIGCKKDNTTPAPANANTLTTSLMTVSGTLTGSSGEILQSFNSSTDGVIAILNEKGEVINSSSLGLQVANFQRWVINGKTRYTYFKTEGTSTLPGVNTTLIGYQYICDSALNVLKTVKLLNNGGINTSVQDKLDEHEFILLDDDHYILLSYYLKQPTNIPDSLHPAGGVTVVDKIIQEIDNNEVVWQWEASQHVEMYGNSVEGNTFSDASSVQDYLHMNSMYIDPKDNNLICSFRNQNQVIKINRTDGSIMWRLGGKNSDFPITENQQFLRQHFARLTDNNSILILLDNGEINERPYSRIMEFQLDEVNKLISNATSYTIPDKFIQYAGSVTKNGDIYLIGGGSAAYTLEVNHVTNEVLMRIAQSASSYRAIKYFN